MNDPRAQRPRIKPAQALSATARAGAALQDAQLIQRSQGGDMSAFEGLVAKYSNLVGSIAYNIIGDVHVAGDITQDTFLKVYRHLPELEEAKRFKGWLCSIVRTTCVSRRSARRGSSPRARSSGACSGRRRPSWRSCARRS